MTWKACLSGSVTPLIPSAPSAWCWTRIEALFAGLPNDAILRAEVAPALPLAQGQRRHRRHHRRARRRHTDAPRAGGIRLRLRHPARPPGQRPDRHAASARGEIPRLRARHQRISVPHRRRRHLACCPSPRSGLNHPVSQRADLHRHPPARRDAGRQRVFPRQQHSAHRHGRHRQDQRRRQFCPGRRPARASACSISPSRNRPTRSSATCVPSALTWSLGSKAACCRFHAARPTLYGLEMHLATMFKEIDTFKPAVVIVDPITSLISVGTETETKSRGC